MKMINKFGATLDAAAILTLAGCGTMNDPFNTSSPASTNSGSANSGNTYSGYGVAQSIELAQQSTANTGLRVGDRVGDRVRIDNGIAQRY